MYSARLSFSSSGCKNIRLRKYGECVLWSFFIKITNICSLQAFKCFKLLILFLFYFLWRKWIHAYLFCKVVFYSSCWVLNNDKFFTVTSIVKLNRTFFLLLNSVYPSRCVVSNNNIKNISLDNRKSYPWTLFG